MITHGYLRSLIIPFSKSMRGVIKFIYSELRLNAPSKMNKNKHHPYFTLEFMTPCTEK